MLACGDRRLNDLIGIVHQRLRILLTTELRAELFLDFGLRLIGFMIARGRLRRVARIGGLVQSLSE
jgi:hypothetical protein